MADEARNTESPDDRAGPGEVSDRATAAEQAKAANPATVADTAASADATAPAGDGEGEGGDGGIDPQLIGLALILWLLAVGIFVYKWDRLKVDWYLGNIKETGDLTGRLDESSVAALASLAADDPDVLRMIGDELVGPLANRDEFYRSAVVKTVERVPGPLAQELIVLAASDYHGVVRANAYVSLGERAKRDPSERERAVAVLLAAVQFEGEPMARAFAISVLGDLGAKEALWPVIKAVRDARGKFGPDVNAEAAAMGERAVRERGAQAFYALSGATAEQLPFDPDGDLAVRDAQVRAWERWFVDNGGTVPQGEGFDDVYPADAAPVTTEAAGPGEGQQGSQ